MGKRNKNIDIDIKVDLKEIEHALWDGITNAKELRRIYNDFVDDIEETWKQVWDAEDGGVLARETGVNHPYETGDYRAHIKKRHIKSRTPARQIWAMARKGVLVGQVWNDDEKAHWIEYGTQWDHAGTHSSYGPETETPEFAPMRRTLARYLGRRISLKRKMGKGRR